MNFVLFSSFLAYCELLLRIFVVFGKIYKWQRRESEKSLVSCFVSPPKIGIYSPKFELRVELHTAHCGQKGGNSGRIKSLIFPDLLVRL